MFVKKFIATAFILALICSGVATAMAQAGKRLEPIRDPELETLAKHNLEVARWNITKRKAYEGARDRLQEIIEVYPDFSQMDEVVYWMGEALLKLDKSEMAVAYYKKLLRDYPDSQFAKKTRERLEELKVDPDKEGR